jgi:hypothetical protein
MVSPLGARKLSVIAFGKSAFKFFLHPVKVGNDAGLLDLFSSHTHPISSQRYTVLVHDFLKNLSEELD